MTEGGKEIINLEGATLCFRALVYLCVSSNSTGLMSANYFFLEPRLHNSSFLEAAARRHPNTSPCDDTAGSCLSFLTHLIMWFLNHASISS